MGGGGGGANKTNAVFFLISVINAIAKYLELVESVRFSLSCLCSLSLKHEEVVIEFP